MQAEFNRKGRSKMEGPSGGGDSSSNITPQHNWKKSKVEHEP